MPDRRKSWGRRILVLLAVGLMTQPALASNCSFWKDLLCATPIASCALTAGFAGAGKMYECVHAGSPWCAECIDGFADPRDRDPNAASGGGAGVACSKDGCHFSNMTEGLSAPPPPVAPGPWKLEDLGVRTLGAPSVIRDSKQIVAFYQGENGHLWMSTHANNDRWWSKAWDLGGTALTCAPAAIALSDNRYHVFYCGPNRHLWMSGWDDGPGWTSPVDLGGVVLQSRPAVVALGATTYRIFYKGPNGHLWVSSWDGGAWWSAPDDLGGVILSSAPTAATVNGEPHHIAVFYAGPNGHLTMSGYNGGPWWSMPIDLRGEQLSGDPSVVSPAEHELDVFYTNSSGDLFQSQWTGGPWWSAPYSRDIKGVAGVGALTGTEVYVRNPTGDLSVAHP